MAALNAKASLVAGVVAAIGASVCCVGPLVLLMLGIGGAWIGNLTAFEPYRRLFIGLTLLFLGLAFGKLYRVPRACAPGTACADPQTARRQRMIFGWVTVLAAEPKTVVLDVQNMTCELCPITVKKALVKATTNAGYPSAAHD